jgi:CheY-like chemotaxis protein
MAWREMSATKFDVLLVEDEPNDVFLIERAFRKCDFQHALHSVNDGEQAVAYLSGVREFADRQAFPLPTLVLLDLKLPRRSGLEVLAWLRNRHDSLRRLPVVVLTSSKQSSDVNRAYELGANSYLVKPVAFDGLLELVKALNGYWIRFNEKPELDTPSSLVSNT